MRYILISGFILILSIIFAVIVFIPKTGLFRPNNYQAGGLNRPSSPSTRGALGETVRHNLLPRSDQASPRGESYQNSRGSISFDKGIFGLKGKTDQAKVTSEVMPASEKHYKTSFNNEVLALRSWPLKQLQAFLPEPQASLVAGMVLGVKTDHLQRLSHLFEVTGMQHVVVASGSNVGLIAYTAHLLLSRFLGSRALALGVGIFILSYVGLVGLTPPLVRAAMMAGLGLLARYGCRRTYYPLWGLLLTVAIIGILYPRWWGEVSFQLSVAACLGILLSLPVFTTSLTLLPALEVGAVTHSEANRFNRLSWWLGMFKEAGLMSLAAQVGTLPLVLHYFHQSSWWALVANSLLLPLVPLLTSLGLLLLALSSVLALVQLDLAAQMAALVILWPASIFLWGLQTLGQVEGTFIGVEEFPLALMVTWWTAWGGVIWVLSKRKHRCQQLSYQFYSSHGV